jgi:hypothetical protein
MGLCFYFGDSLLFYAFLLFPKITLVIEQKVNCHRNTKLIDNDPRIGETGMNYAFQYDVGIL